MTSSPIFAIAPQPHGQNPPRRFDDQLRLRQMSRQVTLIAMTILIRSGARSAAASSCASSRTPCRTIGCWSYAGRHTAT